MGGQKTWQSFNSTSGKGGAAQDEKSHSENQNLSLTFLGHILLMLKKQK
jgi:hypothetical protein